MSYDPRARGARCDECPLKDRVPVPPELRPGSRAILVGEGPGKDEVETGRPFVGRSGIELDRTLAAVGVRRNQVSVTNAVLCPLPGFSMTQARAEHQKENRRREKAGEPKLPTAVECCAPRLRRDLAEHGPNVVTLGGTALGALGIEGSVLEIRGGPRDVETLRVLPTLHPAFVLRARRWTRAFTSDLGRAFRWFSTGLNWVEPQILYLPTADQLRAWLERERGVITTDVETLPGYVDPVNGNEHFDPLKDRLTYIGLASADGRRAVGIPFYSFDRNEQFAPTAFLKPVVAVLKEFFSSPRWVKGGWNLGYYDLMVIEATFKVKLTPILDGIGLHKLAEPELPHNLGYTGSILTDAPSWKDEFHDVETTDENMKVYNGRDCAITALALPQLQRMVVARQQERAAHFWPFVQSVCVELHRNGAYVDQERRERWDLELRRDARRKLKEIHELTGIGTLNPNSPIQLRDLFFEKWNLQPWGDPTDAGDPSTNDDTLRAFLSDSYALDDKRKRIVKAIRRYRAFTKLRGTFVVKLRPFGAPLTDAELAFDEGEDAGDYKERVKRLEGKSGLTMPDGRVHADYSAHRVAGWRLASSNPNMQNFPDDLRDMLTAAPGYVLVGCDEAQLELRMVAALARAEVYLAAFNANEDPHKLLCLDFFGETYERAGKDQKKKLRRFVKEFTYASAYRAGVETVHEVLTSGEGYFCPIGGEELRGSRSLCPEHKIRGEPALLYPNLALRETTAFHAKWLARNPEIARWWEADLEEFRREHYLAEPVFGLRRDFLDGEQKEGTINEIANYKAQSGGAALVHLATREVLRELPKYGARLVQQGHDALVSEVPQDHERYTGEDAEFGFCPPKCGCRANKVARLKEEAMTMDGSQYGLPVRFAGEAKIGLNMKEV